MNKIKDRITLGMLSGVIGTVAGLLLDQIFVRAGISKRSWPTTAGGVWLSSRKEASSLFGQLFGIFMTLGMGILGALQFTNTISKYGKDKLMLKGTFFGITFAAIIHAMLGGIVSQKMKPKDAVTNFSYSVSGALYGVITSIVISLLGHPSLFDSQPLNDQVQPTEKTSEELKLSPMVAK